MGWIAVTKTGKHYARRRVTSFEHTSWDTTTDIREAHRFRSKHAAEKHARLWPDGWKVVQISTPKATGDS